MKRRLLALTLTAVLTTGSALFAFADPLPAGVTAVTDASTPTTQQAGAGFQEHREKRHAAMAALLGLTDAQQAQIKAIITAARQANAPLRQKLATDRKTVKELSLATPFNETAVRTLIASDEATRTDLAVSRIKVRNQIQAVLTPDQQAKAQQLHLLTPGKHRGLGNPRF